MKVNVSSKDITKLRFTAFRGRLSNRLPKRYKRLVQSKHVHHIFLTLRVETCFVMLLQDNLWRWNFSLFFQRLEHTSLTGNSHILEQSFEAHSGHVLINLFNSITLQPIELEGCWNLLRIRKVFSVRLKKMLFFLFRVWGSPYGSSQVGCFCIFGGFQQLSTSIGWHFMTGQGHCHNSGFAVLERLTWNYVSIFVLTGVNAIKIIWKMTDDAYGTTDSLCF